MYGSSSLYNSLNNAYLISLLGECKGEDSFAPPVSTKNHDTGGDDVQQLKQ